MVLYGLIPNRGGGGDLVLCLANETVVSRILRMKDKGWDLFGKRHAVYFHEMSCGNLGLKMTCDREPMKKSVLSLLRNSGTNPSHRMDRTIAWTRTKNLDWGRAIAVASSNCASTCHVGEY